MAATDYMKIVPDQIQRWMPGQYVTLGTDGFGRSDTRRQLRKHFEVDAHHIVIAALKGLADEGQIPVSKVSEAIEKYGVNSEKPNPLYA